jgi:DNA-binding NarL/FixJ family response regulator
MPPPLRVSIVEDDRVTRESLAALIARADDLECLATYPNAEDAMRDTPKRLPDVLLVDIKLPGRSGIECVAALKAAHPTLNVLMLTTYDDTENIFESLRAGASGYLLKRTPSPEIIAAIRDVHEGGSPMSTHIARKVVSHFHTAKPAPEMQTLTPREHEILTLLSRGLHYKEIADQLGISTSTVRAHLHTIYGKLHVQSRTEAVVKFLGR